MDAQKLQREFQTVADAPGGTEELRGLILGLAIRGRLVPRLPEEGRAVAILEDTRPRRKADEGPVQEEPFQCPEHWTWVRFSRVAEHRLGKMLDRARNQGQLRPYLRNANVRWFDFDLSDLLEMRVREDELDQVSLRAGDLVICEGGEPGRCAIWLGESGVMVIQKALHRARPIAGVEVRYLALCLWAAAKSGLLEEFFTGATIKHFTGRSLARFPIPLPPPGEQRRIVDRVHQLMALCDEFQEKQSRRLQVALNLPPAVYSPLAEAETSAGQRAAWSNTRAHFDELTAHPDQVSALRQVILELAVRGRLVEQDPEDVSCGPPVANEEGPFDLPPSWGWFLLGDLIAEGPTNGFSPKGVDYATPVKAITLTATTSGHFDGNYFKYLDIDLPPDSPYWLQPGDFLVQRGNTRDYVGIAAIYDGPQRGFIYPDLMMRFRLKPDLNPSFVHRAMTSPYARSYFSSNASGTSKSMPKINQGTLRRLLVPLPPFAEQRRIVARVDQLMALCDSLEEGLSHRESVSERLARALTAVA